MRILALGDIVGRSGRHIVRDRLSHLVTMHSVDLVIANGENAAHGRGITKEVAKELFSYGIHVITTGNHIWRFKDIISMLTLEERLLRPANFPPGSEGSGHCIVRVKDFPICVINLQGRIYMRAIDCPFRKFDEIYERVQSEACIIIIDFHAEATSEKKAMGWYVDGRASALFGTHTHVQTADETILPGGTAYITDIGMTGAQDSVIGMDKEKSIKNFLLHSYESHEVAQGLATICGILLEIGCDGKAKKIERINCS
ncbi:MAG: TIGR00282 family metallophosphoesterase [Spirochaetes bacterium]|nr:TIGR00282 family metallophosphoesterase [Spirochaetota bacterium]